MFQTHFVCFSPKLSPRTYVKSIYNPRIITPTLHTHQTTSSTAAIIIIIITIVSRDGPFLHRARVTNRPGLVMSPLSLRYVRRAARALSFNGLYLSLSAVAVCSHRDLHVRDDKGPDCAVRACLYIYASLGLGVYIHPVAALHACHTRGR